MGVMEEEVGVYIRRWWKETSEFMSFLEALSPCMPTEVQVIAGFASGGCCVRRFSLGFCEIAHRTWLASTMTKLLERVMFLFAVDL